VRQARDYLAATADLTERQRRDLIWNLLRGLATDNALSAVLDLLNASSPDERGELFGDRRLAERLLSVIPKRHQLRGKLTEFFRESFDTEPEQMALGTMQHMRGRPIPDPLAGQPFSPNLIDPSLPADVVSKLTPQQFEAAIRAADARGWRRPGVPRPVAEAVVRSLGLQRAEQDRARPWLARLADVVARDEVIGRHFSGDPRLGLDQPRQERVIWEALNGLAPGQALDLLDDMPDRNLQVLVAKDLVGVLNKVFPDGHPLHERVAGFLARRLPRGQVMEPTVLDRPFSLEMISPQELAGIDVGDRLTFEQLERVGAVIGSRTHIDIAHVLPRFQRVQQARFDWWWNEFAEPARDIHRAREYLNGRLYVIRDDDLGPALIDPLTRRLEHTARRLLEVLEALDDQQLAMLFADGQLRARADRWLIRVVSLGGCPSGRGSRLRG
jgi:hypothetical protein